MCLSLESRVSRASVSWMDGWMNGWMSFGSLKVLPCGDVRGSLCNKIMTTVTGLTDWSQEYAKKLWNSCPSCFLEAYWWSSPICCCMIVSLPFSHFQKFTSDDTLDEAGKHVNHARFVLGPAPRTSIFASCPVSLVLWVGLRRTLLQWCYLLTSLTRFLLDLRSYISHLECPSVRRFMLMVRTAM